MERESMNDKDILSEIVESNQSHHSSIMLMADSLDVEAVDIDEHDEKQLQNEMMNNKQQYEMYWNYVNEEIKFEANPLDNLMAQRIQH